VPDGLGGVDVLEAGAAHSEMGVTELALDDRQGHPFAGHLDRICVVKLMRGEASAHARDDG